VAELGPKKKQYSRKEKAFNETGTVFPVKTDRDVIPPQGTGKKGTKTAGRYRSKKGQGNERGIRSVTLKVEGATPVREIQGFGVWDSRWRVKGPKNPKNA